MISGLWHFCKFSSNILVGEKKQRLTITREWRGLHFVTLQNAHILNTNPLNASQKHYT